ncbi:hypothetical protein [Pseudoalteromonas viridis]|uniref:Uncharacterized protein n=1 Tax=Pseudoalteromonas viridis TaxID=339617 RepID=A0ABX7V1R5_9GAMM|nr:hypothetical protein [Pseudoalteromonas viridis]QTL34749.1 hypothetical protein J5X90_14575 [Pseudoalteromonas viridis]
MFKNKLILKSVIAVWFFNSSLALAEGEMTYGDRLIKGTHNSYSGSIDRQGNHRGSIIQQLNKGFKSLEFDVHPYNKQNIYLNHWSAKEREFTTFSLGEDTFSLDYRPDNGQVAINRFSDDGAGSATIYKNVYLSHWSPKAREFTSFTFNGKAFVLAYQQQDGLVGIAEFSYHNDQGALNNVYLGDWANKKRVFTAFSLEERAFVVNYREDSGLISIDEFNYHDGKATLSNVYQGSWAKKSREFSTFKLMLDSEERVFIANYREDSGQFSIDEFNINGHAVSLGQVYKANWARDRARELATFSVDDKAYIVNYTHSNGIVSIDEFFRGQNEFEMGKAVHLTFSDAERKITALNVQRVSEREDGHPVLYLGNYRRDNGQVSVDRIELNTPTMGHDDIGHDVDFNGNPADLRLEAWLQVIADWQAANPTDREPLFLMIELKGHHRLEDYFRLWLPGDKVNHVINTVYRTFGQDNVRLFDSKRAKEIESDVVNANTPYAKLMGKVILYIEPKKDILGEDDDCERDDFIDDTEAVVKSSMEKSYEELCGFRYGSKIIAKKYKGLACAKNKSCTHPGDEYLHRLFRMGEGDSSDAGNYPNWYCGVFNFLSSDIVDQRYLGLTCPDKG